MFIDCPQHILFLSLFAFCQIDWLLTFDSIQCCTGDDNTCSSQPVDCPSNICFKLVINKISEERGCIDDLMKLLNLGNRSSRLRTSSSGGGGEEKDRGLTSVSTDDQCQKLGSYPNGMSLCKCTTHLCNSTNKQIFFSSSSFLLAFFWTLVSFLRRRSIV